MLNERKVEKVYQDNNLRKYHEICVEAAACTVHASVPSNHHLRFHMRNDATQLLFDCKSVFFLLFLFCQLVTLYGFSNSS